MLVIVLVYLVLAVAMAIGAGIGVVAGTQYLLKRFFRYELPKWLAVILFLIAVIGIPAGYHVWQESMAIKTDKRDLAAITFNIFEPNTISGDYKRNSIQAYPNSGVYSHVNFLYLNPTESKTSPDRTFTVNETAEADSSTELCNFIPPEIYNTSDETPECEYQTTPKGIKWYHGEDTYGGRKNDFTVQSGTRVTIQHLGLTNGQLGEIFDGLTQKQAAEIDVKKNAHDFNFLGIQF